MQNLTTSAKEAGKSTPANSSPTPTASSIIEVSAVEIKPTRTVQEFLDSMDRGNYYVKRHTKSLERIKEIRKFKDKVQESSSVLLTIEHHASGDTLEFPHISIIQDFIDEQLRKGETEIVDLEGKMKDFNL